MFRKYQFRGFTLIELLVVIAIISVLISILMPSLSKAKELAKMSVCATQERGIGMAMQVYTQDNDDYYPISQWWNPDRRANYFYTYKGPTYNYYSTVPVLHRNGYVSFKAFYCPSKKYIFKGLSIEDHERGGYPLDTYFNWSWEAIRTHSGHKHPVLLRNATMGTLRGVSPGLFAIMGDEVLYPETGNNWSAGIGWPAGPIDIFLTSHDSGSIRGSNILFGEGHVQWLGKSSLQYPYAANGQVWPVENVFHISGNYWEAYPAVLPISCP